MITRRRFTLALAVAALAGVLAAAPRAAVPAADLPARLTDQEFWALTDELSETNGSFRSDNFLSNETGYQVVIPDLVARAKSGGVYMGVGPEQNFPYILALKPKIAFILDIRRGNLHEQLLYKALFEMSATRAEFLGKLFSRKQPAGLGEKSAVEELFAAYDTVAPSEDLYKENLKAVTDWLTKKHAFALRADDPEGVAYVYREAFYVGGPQLNYAMGRGTGMGRGGSMATYENLMFQTDGAGKNRGFLATEENWAYLKDLETKNLIVPLVGNFGGPKAIRAVGTWLKARGATVSAFYLSNVEQYLIQDGIWNNFCASVATLPLDETSTFIFSGRGGPSTAGGGFGGGRGGRGGAGGMGQTNLRPIQSEVKACSGGGASERVKEGSR